MSEETKLKKCPFCRSVKVWPVVGVSPFIYCSKCQTCGPRSNSEAEAITLWDTRPTETEAWEAAREEVRKLQTPPLGITAQAKLGWIPAITAAFDRLVHAQLDWEKAREGGK